MRHVQRQDDKQYTQTAHKLLGVDTHGPGAQLSRERDRTVTPWGGYLIVAASMTKRYFTSEFNTRS